MARCKDVNSLFHLSLIQVCNLILCSSKFICKRHGPCENSKLKKQLCFVQRYILNHIHPHFLDEIINNLHKLSPFQWLLNDWVKSYIVAVCMHPRMKSFKPRFQLPVNDELYMFHLRSMNHLRSLNLSMVCSDEILEIVGKSCPLLEYIDITSKVESATNSAIRFNALKLRFFVSDKGLEYLYQCKCLQTILMNSIIRSNCGGRKISNVGIKNLLLNLKLLKFINYQDMGLVLEEISSDERKLGLLNLAHLHDNHVTPDHIDLFSFLCPGLQSLSLCIPQTNQNQDLSRLCLDRLSANCITLSGIDLWYFIFNSSLINFLAIKGKYLSTLSLKDCKDTEIKALYDICTYCPNLKILRVNQLNQGDNDGSIPKECHFINLEELHLAGSNWDPGIIFNMCLIKSLGLKVLSLSNKGFPFKLDREIKYLMLKNPLMDLIDISLLDGCKISFPLLKEFLVYCTSLGRITVIDDNSESLSEQLIYFISSNPFDISIDIKIERSR